MDLIRALLIGVIAALSFMLLTEWVNFKQQAADTTIRPTEAGTTAVTSSIPSAPVADDTVPASDEDIPSVTQAAAEDSVPTVEPAAAVSDSILVRIGTGGGGSDIADCDQ